MMGDLAKMSSGMVYVVLFIICVIAAYILLSLNAWTTKMKNSMRKGGKSGSAKGSVITLLFLLITSFLLVYFSMFFYYYGPLRGDMYVARMNLEKSKTKSGEFRVFYTPLEGGQPGNTLDFNIKGNSFSVEAEFLQWQSLLQKAGFPSMFRVLKLRGHYPQSMDGKNPGEKMLAGGDNNTLWQIIRKVNQVLPLAKVRVISSEKFLPLSGVSIEVHANINGLSIGKSTPSAKSSVKGNQEKEEQKKVRYPRKPEDVRH